MLTSHIPSIEFLNIKLIFFANTFVSADFLFIFFGHFLVFYTKKNLRLKNMIKLKIKFQSEIIFGFKSE